MCTLVFLQLKQSRRHDKPTASRVNLNLNQLAPFVTHWYKPCACVEVTSERCKIGWDFPCPGSCLPVKPAADQLGK
jgi:hypothetical protein